MFPCACSLRSTQCAALIALAAAAGILRVEPAQRNITRTPGLSSDDVTRSYERVSRSLPDHFEAGMNAYAPWLQWIKVAKELAADAEATAETLLVSPALEAKDPPIISRGPPALSARQHAFPFAVGPPACEETWTPRADDTDVSRDSAVRRRLASGLASSLHFFAPSAHPGNPVPRTELFSNPSSALRGEPDGDVLLLASIGPSGLCPDPDLPERASTRLSPCQS